MGAHKSVMNKKRIKELEGVGQEQTFLQQKKSETIFQNSLNQ